jgi:hypothetical protein
MRGKIDPMEQYLEKRLKDFGIVCPPPPRGKKNEMLFEIPKTEAECEDLVRILVIARREFNN